MILCKLLFVGFLTQTEYTKNPFSAVSLPEVACEFAPTVFSATAIALLKDVCTLDSIVCDNVEESCIEPVQFELAATAEGLFFIELVTSTTTWYFQSGSEHLLATHMLKLKSQLLSMRL